jgi:tetratricopeptide (TPR) repeat protein
LHVARIDETGLRPNARIILEGLSWRIFLEEATVTAKRIAVLLLVGLCPLGLRGQAASPAGARGLTQRTGTSTLTGKVYALLIGISRYQNDPPVPSLQFADKDAETFRDLLASPVGGGLDEASQIRLLTNEKATQAAIVDAVENFAVPNASPENTLILFVAAHGVYLKAEVNPETHKTIESDPYILTYDSNTQDPKMTGYSMSDFRLMIAQQAQRYGRVLVFVDVCHAENVAGIAGGSELQEPVRQVFGGGYGDLGLMMATQANKSALESANFGGGHGAFSYFLISGLNGAAAEPTEDSLTFGELFHYVYNEVYRNTAHQQEPSQIPPPQDLIVVPDIHRTGIMLPPAQPITKSDARDIRSRQAKALTQHSTPPASAQRQEIADAWDRAIASGILLPEEPGSAYQLLSQMRQDVSFPPAELAEREQRLHVALEDKGQQIVSRYLDGEQQALKKSDFDRCGRYFAVAFTLAPSEKFDNSRALFCEGRALIFDAQYDNAENLLRQSIGIDPQRSYAYNALGIAELERAARTGQGLQEAANDFNTATRFAPYWAYPVHNLALLETERGNYDDSIRLYQAAMQVAPRFSYLPYNLGLVYERLGDLPNAEHWFDRARGLTEQFRPQASGAWPERARVWNALGTVARAQRQNAKAEALFKNAITDDAQDPNARQNLALILAAKGDTAGADKLWLANLGITPKFMPSWISYAESLAARGSAAPAIGIYEQIVEELKDYVGARVALARLYLSQHQAAQALAQMDAALQLSASDPAVLELRGDAEEALGRPDAAKADWKRAAAVASDRASRARLKQKLK